MSFESPNTRIASALEIAERYGRIDGDHHKMWVIDQMVRALMGEYYETWVAQNSDEDHPWDGGIAP